MNTLPPFNSLFNLENTGPKLLVCDILCSYIQWCNKSSMHKKINNTKLNIILIQYNYKGVTFCELKIQLQTYNY